MDSLAYSVMLEIKANTSNLNKDLKKSLSIVEDHNKQINKAYNDGAKAAKGFIDIHRGTNKVLKEQMNIWNRIGFKIGEILKTISELPGKIAYSIGSMASMVIRTIGTTITSTIGLINKTIDEAIKRYHALMEEWRIANFQAAGGVKMLNNEMIKLQFSLGASVSASKEIVEQLVFAGFRAKTMGKGFSELSNTMWKFQRVTGVSHQTTAKLMKSLTGTGHTIQKTQKIVEGFAEGMAQANLTTQETTQLMENLSAEMYTVEMAFGTKAVEKYADALVILSGAAKMVGVNVSEATTLMSSLSKDPMKFVVALGSDALYKSANENMRGLVRGIKEIKESMFGIPPGMMASMIQEIYGLNAAQVKILESVEEFEKKYPGLKKFGKIFEDANKSIYAMWDIFQNKILAVLSKVGQSFASLQETGFAVLFKNVAESAQRLQKSMIELINTVFNVEDINAWGEANTEWLKEINEWFVSLVDSATAWVKVFSQSDNILLIKNYVKDIYNIIVDDVIPAAIGLAVIIKDAVFAAVVFVWDVFKLVFNYVDRWVKTGGPERLLEKFKWIGEKILWIADHALPLLGGYLALKILPTIIGMAAGMTSMGIALAPIMPIVGIIAAGLALGYGLHKLINRETDKQLKTAEDMISLTDKRNKSLINMNKLEESLAGLSKKEAMSKIEASIKEQEKIKRTADGRAEQQRKFAKEQRSLRATDLLLGLPGVALRKMKGGAFDEKAVGYEGDALAAGSEIDMLKQRLREVKAGGDKIPGLKTKGKVPGIKGEKSTSETISDFEKSVAKVWGKSDEIFEKLRKKHDELIKGLDKNTEATKDNTDLYATDDFKDYATNAEQVLIESVGRSIDKGGKIQKMTVEDVIQSQAQDRAMEKISRMESDRVDQGGGFFSNKERQELHNQFTKEALPGMREKINTAVTDQLGRRQEKDPLAATSMVAEGYDKKIINQSLLELDARHIDEMSGIMDDVLGNPKTIDASTIASGAASGAAAENQGSKMISLTDKQELLLGVLHEGNETREKQIKLLEEIAENNDMMETFRNNPSASQAKATLYL